MYASYGMHHIASSATTHVMSIYLLWTLEGWKGTTRHVSHSCQSMDISISISMGMGMAIDLDMNQDVDNSPLTSHLPPKATAVLTWGPWAV